LFNLKETDIGRPLHHFSTNILYSDLIKDAGDLLNTLRVKEIEVQSKDGEWYIMSIIPYKTVENVVDGVVITFFDITGRKKAGAEIIKAHEFSRAVLNSISEAVSIINVKDLRIVDCNSSFLQHLGVKREDVIGKTCYEVTHHAKNKMQCMKGDGLCPIDDTLRTGDHVTVEHIHYQKDGRKVYVEVSASSIRNEDGKIHQVVHVARDITERKLTEEKFRETIKGLNKQLNEMKKKKR
jgi:two-component system CheB/CheR fusion protein